MTTALSTTEGRLFSAIAICCLLYALGNGNFAALSRVRIVVAGEEITSTALPASTAISSVIDPAPAGVNGGAKFDLATVAAAENIELGKEDLTLDQKRQAYIRRFGSVAVAEMKQYGIPASITIAQGLLETRAGTSGLATKNNNHFGVKCFSRNCRRGHCSNFTDDTHKDFFVKYPNAWASFRAHSQLLTSGRYAKLKQYGLDYRAWAKGLKQAGYATAPDYAESLIRLIRLYGLDRLDRM